MVSWICWCQQELVSVFGLVVSTLTADEFVVLVTASEVLETRSVPVNEKEISSTEAGTVICPQGTVVLLQLCFVGTYNCSVVSDISINTFGWIVLLTVLCR